MRRIESGCLVALIVLAACGNDTGVKIDDADAEARATYPDLAAIYDGERGLYRGCGPNGGVCHNGNEFPNLDSMGSIVANIDIARRTVTKYREALNLLSSTKRRQVG